ncbi:MAG: energy-coupling factor transporter ATPase, partial [Lachnospiraceae bacterium]|nr:energy-coupling factor transporter ATPase [Lachnospiraceae bacterium]
MNGLLKPTSGEILYNGQNIHDKDYDRNSLRAKVGLVFQYPEYQLFESDVFTDVCFGPKNLKLSKVEVEARAYDALNLMGLPKEKWYSSPFELSGGQMRRAAIAGVLAMKPQVLVLDEPTAGLDPKGRDELLDVLSRMRTDEGMTVVLVSHSMEDMSKYADRVVVMNKGKLVMNGTPGQIFSRYKELEQIHLSAPAVTYIMEELRRAGLSVPIDVRDVDEAAEAIKKIIL